MRSWRDNIAAALPAAQSITYIHKYGTEYYIYTQGVRDPHAAVSRQPAEGKAGVPEEEKVEEVTSFRSNEREGGRERERGVPAPPPRVRYACPLATVLM